MTMNRLRTVLLFSLLLHSIVGQQGEECVGLEAESLKEGCTSIGTKALIFKGDQDASIIKEKLKNVQRIESGVKVSETSLETFDFLSHITQITNLDGPAITFTGNKKLKRLDFKSLTELSGKEVTILFEKDNFPNAVKNDKESMADLLYLENISRKTRKDEEKCHQFVKIIPLDAPASNLFLIIGIILMFIGATIMVAQFIYFLKFKKPAKGNGETQDEEKKPEENQAPAQEKSAQKSLQKSAPKSLPKEDPKNK